MKYILLAIVFIFYMVFVIIKTNKKEIDRLRCFLNSMSYMDLKSTLVKDREEDR